MWWFGLLTHAVQNSGFLQGHELKKAKSKTTNTAKIGKHSLILKFRSQKTYRKMVRAQPKI